MKFSDLSPASTAKSIRYVTSEASCLYFDKARNSYFKISIPCPSARGCFFSGFGGELKDCANPYIERLDKYMDINSYGRYVQSPNIHYVKTILSGACISLGLLAKDYPYFASIRMNSDDGILRECLISVPIKNEDSIRVEKISKQDWLDAEKIDQDTIKKNISK